MVGINTHPVEQNQVIVVIYTTFNMAIELFKYLDDDVEQELVRWIFSICHFYIVFTKLHDRPGMFHCKNFTIVTFIEY